MPEFQIIRCARVIWVLGLLLMAGCASQAIGPVKQNISQAETMISRAVQSGAEEYAPLELKLAEEKLQEARAALEAEETDVASQKAEEAMMKAKLAEARARTEKARTRVRDEQKDVELLRNESGRTRSE
ncbi:DUF4398 domain-containing protein [Desulfonema ishimotonii]|uniref:DUF4398 domain-containing protein n=1 Tax=Desulfonema ishimotonii TaxID=45657 RepID=A0A401G1C9_9BACT|nr:DUF4398 domain-containing protein [Desulfonema ishimotonii]GBC62993.1 DUF4398 domain-containing protein [Desulfonema ishimotonii]